MSLVKKILMNKPVSFKAAAILISGFTISSCANIDTNALIDASTQIAVAALGQNSQQSQNVLAIKDMLSLSGDRASSYLSQMGAWNQVLPENVQQYLPVLKMLDTNNYLGSIETSMKQAASQAANEAAPVFKQAVADMTILNALDIIKGGSTAATDYFQSKTESTLRQKFTPILTSNLQKTGFYSQYQYLQNIYNAAPISNKQPLDLEGYIADKALNSMFSEMSKQEQLIRQDPLGRGSQLINTVLNAN